MKSSAIINLVGLAKGTTKTTASGLRANRAGFLTELLKSLTPSSKGETVISKALGKGLGIPVQTKSQQSNDHAQGIKTAPATKKPPSSIIRKTAPDSPPKAPNIKTTASNNKSGVLQSLGVGVHNSLVIEEPVSSSKALPVKAETSSRIESVKVDNIKSDAKEITSLGKKHVREQVQLKAAVQPVRAKGEGLDKGVLGDKQIKSNNKSIQATDNKSAPSNSISARKQPTVIEKHATLNSKETETRNPSTVKSSSLSKKTSRPLAAQKSIDVIPQRGTITTPTQSTTKKHVVLNNGSNQEPGKSPTITLQKSASNSVAQTHTASDVRSDSKNTRPIIRTVNKGASTLSTPKNMAVDSRTIAHDNRSAHKTSPSVLNKTAHAILSERNITEAELKSLGRNAPTQRNTNPSVLRSAIKPVISEKLPLPTQSRKTEIGNVPTTSRTAAKPSQTINTHRNDTALPKTNNDVKAQPKVVNHETKQALPKNTAPKQPDYVKPDISQTFAKEKVSPEVRPRQTPQETARVGQQKIAEKAPIPKVPAAAELLKQSSCKQSIVQPKDIPTDSVSQKSKSAATTNTKGNQSIPTFEKLTNPQTQNQLHRSISSEIGQKGIAQPKNSVRIETSSEGSKKVKQDSVDKERIVARNVIKESVRTTVKNSLVKELPAKATSGQQPKSVQRENTFARNDVVQEKPIVQQPSENSLQASLKSAVAKNVLRAEAPTIGTAKEAVQPEKPISDMPQTEKPVKAQATKAKSAAAGVLDRDISLKNLSPAPAQVSVKTIEEIAQKLQETATPSPKQRAQVEFPSLGYARQVGMPIPVVPKQFGSKASMLMEGASLDKSVTIKRDIPITIDNMTQASDDKNSSKTFSEQRSTWKPSQVFRTNWQLAPNTNPEIASAPPTPAKRYAEPQATRTTSLPQGSGIEPVTQDAMQQSAPKENSVLGNSLTAPAEDWNIRNIDGGVETSLHSRLALKQEQLQELRALVDRVFKSSQPLQLDKGSGLKFTWMSKEWGPIKFTIGQFDQEIVAKVKVKSLEVQALLETHSDKLQKLFADQGLRLDRFEIESPANAKLSALPEVKWDEPRRQHGRSDTSNEQPSMRLPDTEIAPPVQAGRKQMDRHVWIA